MHYKIIGVVIAVVVIAGAGILYWQQATPSIAPEPISTATSTPNPQSPTFSATPTSGTAPLTVSFSGVGSSIDFGNGTGQQESGGLSIGKTTYTYSTAGTYTATSGGQSVTITVTANSSTFSATPTSGTAPHTVTFKIVAHSYDKDVLAFGDSSSASFSFPAITCPAGSGPCTVTKTISHTYTAVGSYTAALTIAGQAYGTVTITVNRTASP